MNLFDAVTPTKDKLQASTDGASVNVEFKTNIDFSCLFIVTFSVLKYFIEFFQRSLLDRLFFTCVQDFCTILYIT